MNFFEFYRDNFFGNGKIEVILKVLVNREILSFVYIFGVVEFLKVIVNGVDLDEYIVILNIVVVVIDGLVILGFGDIGLVVGMFVMEGKVVFFKVFVGVDVFLIFINMKDVDEIVRMVELISFGFGGINLEDILVFRCFEIEERLRERFDILVFYDD